MKKKLFAVLILFSIAAVANATLQTIGTATYDGTDYKLIYDVEDQLTWLDYSRPGVEGYAGSVAWAASLNNPGELTINLDSGYTGLWDSSQWQLPQMGGYSNYFGNVYYFAESTIYDLYYNELGNIANDPSINTGPFDNFVADLTWTSWYWLEPTFDSGITYKPAFSFKTGLLAAGNGATVSVNGGIYAMAVISGAVVPEPTTLAILGLGILALRRKK